MATGRDGDRTSGRQTEREGLQPLFGGLVPILAALLAGELLHLTCVPLPGSVLGMVLLAAALALRVTRPERVRPASRLLVGNMSILFVPAGVGVMAYADLLSRVWLPIVSAVAVSTSVVLLCAGPLQRSAQRLVLRRRAGGKREDAG